LWWGRKKRRNMEEFQDMARPQKMATVVLSKIVQGSPVHRLDGVQRKIGTAVFQGSSRGDIF
jgi:hypothetical protein